MSSNIPTKPLLLWNELDPYQKRAVCFSAVRSGSGLFFDQGTGKTWIALGLIEYTEANSVLLVVPKTNLTTTWANLITKKLPDYEILYEWDDFKKSKHPQKILLVNYEKLPSIITKVQRYGKKKAWDLIIYDESQRLKNRNSKASKFANRLRYLADCKVVMSGTPMDDSPIDLWAQLRFVIPEIVGETWTGFVGRWCYKGGFMNKQVFFREELLNSFMSSIRPHVRRINLEDVVDLPPPVEEFVYVDLDEEHRRIYDDMDKEMVTRVGRHRTMAQLVITKNVKLAQITGGWIKDDNDKIHRVGTAKQDAIRDLLKKVKPPVVIFCKHIEDMAIIDDALPRKDRVEWLYGKVKDTKKNQARSNLITEFQEGKIDWLIVQIKTGGVGIDLYQSSHTAIFFSMGHSFIDNDQAKKRLYRRGQKKQVRLFFIVARNTIDDDLVEAYRSKRSLTEVVLEKVKQRRNQNG